MYNNSKAFISRCRSGTQDGCGRCLFPESIHQNLLRTFVDKLF